MCYGFDYISSQLFAAGLPTFRVMSAHLRCDGWRSTRFRPEFAARSGNERGHARSGSCQHVIKNPHRAGGGWLHPQGTPSSTRRDLSPPPVGVHHGHSVHVCADARALHGASGCDSAEEHSEGRMTCSLGVESELARKFRASFCRPTSVSPKR